MFVPQKPLELMLFETHGGSATDHRNDGSNRSAVCYGGYHPMRRVTVMGFRKPVSENRAFQSDDWRAGLQGAFDVRQHADLGRQVRDHAPS
jgi:hypothetical protein